MAYATAKDLASALNLKVNNDNVDDLEACLNAAATEIDHFLDRQTPFVEIDPGLLIRVNIDRAVEWWKSPDAYNGGVGYQEVGTLPAKLSGFERHAAVLLPYQDSWGIA